METSACNYCKKKCSSLAELFHIDQSIDIRASNKRLKSLSSRYTLRLEHRETGNPGEERILLFRSDHPGVIAKVVFSSSPAKSDEEFGESDSGMAQAKIHVLEVKEAYRGRDLGGLLFTEVLSSLRNRYDSTTDNTSSIRCELDAEEDSRRYNRLVNFYEQLGCSVKPQAKVRFLNHNDGETYRSVPMEIALRHSLRRRFTTQDPSEKLWSSLVGIPGGFLPISFKNHGSKIRIHSLDTILLNPRVEWLIVEDSKGFIFRSTHGHHLLACPDGKVLAVADTDNNQFESIADWEYFDCYRIPDGDDSTRQNELWLFQTARGMYLSMDMELKCSAYPSFWKVDAESYTLQYTTDTPRRRQHYKQDWARQSIEYVLKMREKYSGFELCKMNIKKALELVKNLPSHCFKIEGKQVSIRTFLFSMAEEARLYGHPDWFQLVALIHDLGRVIKLIDVSSLKDFQEYDWTIAIMSRVVGCNPSNNTSFKEFSYLRSDSNDSRYNTNLGIYQQGCGIQNLLLTWTGQEYLHSMLKHNKVAIPDEGLAIIRYFLLNEWHTHDELQSFQSVEDEDLKYLVLDFYDLRQRVKRGLKKELSDEECDKLWERHYEWIAVKYGCSGDLDW